MKARILGIDTKSRAFHWVSSYESGWDMGSFTSIHEDHDMARAEVFEYSRELFEESDEFDHVFCEAPLALQNGKTTRLLCMAAAAMWCGYVASGSTAIWYWVDPATWKRDVLGGAPPRGMKHKPWIRQRCLELWPETITDEVLAQFDFEPDFFDAWCLMRYGRQVVDSF